MPDDPSEAAAAAAAYTEGDHATAHSLLQGILSSRDQDPKVLHNVAITDYAMGGCKEPRKLLAVLERLRARVEEAREKADASDSIGSDLVGDADPSLLAYNSAVVLYQLKQYGKARAVLDDMFAQIEPVDEFLAFRSCFLLLDLQLLQRQLEKAAEVLAYLERSYAMLTKSDGGRENGSAESRDSADGASSLPSDWPNKRSARRPPTDISPEEVRSALNLYKAKLALLARSSKSSKREIKTTLNACAQDTTGLFLKANNESLRQNYRKAMKLLSNCNQRSERDPNFAALYYNNMGCIHHSMRRHTAAAFYFGRALRENASLCAPAANGEAVPLTHFSCDRRSELEYNRGLQLLLAGKGEAAFACFHAALKLLHRQPRAWLRAGEACIAAHLEREQAVRAGRAGSRPSAVGCEMLGVGGRRRLLLPVGERLAAAEIADESEEPPPQPTTESAIAAPTLEHGVKCLRAAITQCDEALRTAGGLAHGALVARAAQGTLSQADEYALQVHTVRRVATLQLAWCALVLADPLAALGWCEALLACEGLAHNLKAHAHTFACDALCHLDRSAEAAPHAREALALSDAMGGVVAASEAPPAGEGNELEPVRNVWYEREALGDGKAAAGLYATLASVHVLRDDLAQARACVAQAMSLVGNPLLGMMLFITHWFVTFLFSGLFIKISSVIWPLRILCYITPMRWGMPSMIYQAFSPYDGERGDVFEGAGKCTPSPFFGPLFCYGGFFCEGISPLECYGRTGKDILGTVGINFDVISDEFTMWTDIAYMVAIAVCWKLLFVVQLNRLCSGGTAPSAPAAKKKPPRKGDKAAVDGPVREVEPAAAAQGTGLSSQATDASELGFDPLATADVEVGDIDQMRQMRMTSVAAVPLQSQPTVSLQDFANRGSREAARKLRSGGEQTELAFIECSYTLTIAPKSRWAKFVPLPAAERCCGAKATEKRLVSNVSASVSAGHVLAVMGPSGAGKTTMLNMLTLDPGSGNATGFLTLNGHPLTPALYAQHCAYVTQQDLLWTFLTCREHLRMALDLYRPSLSAKERETAIDDLLDSTGLMSCQHTKAGNMFFRGLSGGQKRRLSLAIALAKRPSVIFLDEPTSGLDSAASAKIMSFLKVIAQRTKIAIVCTIHQPSASVFEGFDDTLILSSGRIAYFGPAAQLAQHLADVGRPMQPNANPAEYALDVVNADFTSPGSVKEVLDAWPKYAPTQQRRTPRPLAPRPQQATFCGQTLTLLKRHAVLTVREPMLYTARMVVIFAVTVFFCVVYLESRQLTQVQIMQKAFYVFWFVCVPVAFPVIAVYALNAEFVTVKKEVKDGMYGPMAYALANGLLQLPMMFTFGLCAMLPTYLILGWPWDTFLTTLALFSAHCWAFECIAQFFSLSANPLVGMLKYLNVWFISALFSGLVFRGRDVIWPLRLLYYCLPMKWFFGATAYSIMASSPPYEGTLACNSTGAGAVSYCPDEGFYCPSTEEDPFGLSCYGETGPQILDSLSKTYDAISSENTVLTDLIAILAIGVFFKVNYCVYLYASCTAGRMPNPPRQIKI
mmetsp:Transcript_10170/g.33454  ORF Transcript_10170/g.33454 Transcript_10170/m.33454 type:complete len:1546 (-) Transcript_10170:270-4907(-)